MRKLVNAFNISKLKCQAAKYGVHVILDDNVKLRQCSLWASKRNAGKKKAVSFKCGADSSIKVEDGFLFSNSIDLCTTDFHPVYDKFGNRMNPNKDIVIEKGCWIGRKVYIGKGVRLAWGLIVGAYAVVTKSFDENNVMIAGNPAVIKKRNIYWKE